MRPLDRDGNWVLKPCPFCGNKIDVELFTLDDLTFVECGACDVQASIIAGDKRTTLEEREQEAIKIWNSVSRGEPVVQPVVTLNHSISEGSETSGEAYIDPVSAVVQQVLGSSTERWEQLAHMQVNDFLEGSIGGPPEFHEVKRAYRDVYLRAARLKHALQELVNATDWTAIGPLHDDVASGILERIDEARTALGESK